MPSYWFGDVDGGRCLPFRCLPFTGGKAALSDRIRSLSSGTVPADFPDWQEAIRCGACRDRADYIARLRALCISSAISEIRTLYAGREVELLQMIRMLDGMDEAVNLLSERAAEWYHVRHHSFTRKYRRVPSHSLVRAIGRKSRGALVRIAGEIDSLANAMAVLAKEVSFQAEKVMPNTSALIGGLVAARLMAEAGGLEKLAVLPASTIQVLGARTAIFAHIRMHSPPPKHGVIFQHRRVHNAVKERRGKVARVLAGKLAIAARLDFYRGAEVPEFLESAQQCIDAAFSGSNGVTGDPDR